MPRARTTRPRAKVTATLATPTISTPRCAALPANATPNPNAHRLSSPLPKAYLAAQRQKDAELERVLDGIANHLALQKGLVIAKDPPPKRKSRSNAKEPPKPADATPVQVFPHAIAMVRELGFSEAQARAAVNYLIETAGTD